MTRQNGPWTGLTLAQGSTLILRAALAFRLRERRWPNTTDGYDVLLTGASWSTANRWLTKRYTCLLLVCTGKSNAVIRSLEERASAIFVFHKKHGWWPRQGAKDLTEKRLGSALSYLRHTHPEICTRHGIPLKADIGEAVRHGRGKQQFSTLGEIASLFCRNFSASVTTGDIEGEKGATLNQRLVYAHSKPSESRGLGRAPDLCQVNSIARLRSEIKHDCWRVWLKGIKTSDKRKWAAILASGDNVKVERAKRIAYLDWENLDMDAVETSGPRAVSSLATRRPWVRV